MNVVDAAGALIRNVGGDYMQPHRTTDPDYVTFLDGIRVNTRFIELLATWEMVNQMWLDVHFQFESVENEALHGRAENGTLEVRLRTEL
jgi:hypothetical protein